MGGEKPPAKRIQVTHRSVTDRQHVRCYRLQAAVRAASGQLPPGWRCAARRNGDGKLRFSWKSPEGASFFTDNEVMEHLGLPQRQREKDTHTTTASELEQARAEAGAYGLQTRNGLAATWVTAAKPSSDQPGAPEAPTGQQPAAPAPAAAAPPAARATSSAAVASLPLVRLPALAADGAAGDDASSNAPGPAVGSKRPGSGDDAGRDGDTKRARGRPRRSDIFQTDPAAAEPVMPVAAAPASQSAMAVLRNPPPPALLAPLYGRMGSSQASGGFAPYQPAAQGAAGSPKPPKQPEASAPGGGVASDGVRLVQLLQARQLAKARLAQVQAAAAAARVKVEVMRMALENLGAYYSSAGSVALVAPARASMRAWLQAAENVATQSDQAAAQLAQRLAAINNAALAFL